MLLSLPAFGFVKFPSLRRAVILAAAKVVEMHRVWQGRQAIAKMDARMLADIGLSRSEAQDEVNRKPWDMTPRR